MRITTGLSAVLLLITPALAVAKDLSDDNEIRQALIGNTISGIENGKPFVEYLAPDGQILGKDKDGRYTGHWQIGNGGICFSYDPDEGQEARTECMKVGIEGSKVIWIEDGERSSANLIPGNPKGF